MDDFIVWLKSLSSPPPEIAGFLMAMFMSVVRILADSKEKAFMRIVQESFLCGALALTCSFGIEAMGLNQNWAVFAGGVIGYLGSHTVRYFAFNLITKKIDKS